METSQRPARLVVVAVAWMLIAALSAQLALALIVISLDSGSDDFGRLLVGIGLSLTVTIAVVGVTAAIGLLRLRPWSRVVLEILTWGCCAICLAAFVFGVYNFVTWPTPADRWVPAVSMVGYPLPLAVFCVLLWALRSTRMRQAFARTA